MRRVRYWGRVKRFRGWSALYAPPDVERLLGAIWADAYRLARGIVIQAQSAEDVAKEACITIFRSIASLRKSDAFRTWFSIFVSLTDFETVTRRLTYFRFA